ncbi:hypothetical protein ABZW30_00635 [Kitasatospora sp. NPDC004669]|uniref:hypothetical protein n=1 Tax=Kitasatospora sp. NPDC004669 TaxID=3154555 RepID=UPI0033B4524E
MQSGGAELNLGFPGGCRDGSPAAPAWWPALTPEVTVDQLDAAERCEALLRETVGAVRPAPVWREVAPRTGVRLPLPGRESESHWYVTRGRDLLTLVSPCRQGELVAVVERHWRRRGWTITSLNVGRDRPGVAAVTGDGYQLVLGVGEFGEITLTAGSPGAACPQRWATGEVASLPNVHCPYWSALM